MVAKQDRKTTADGGCEAGSREGEVFPGADTEVVLKSASDRLLNKGPSCLLEFISGPEAEQRSEAVKVLNGTVGTLCGGLRG